MNDKNLGERTQPWKTIEISPCTYGLLTPSNPHDISVQHGSFESHRTPLFEVDGGIMRIQLLFTTLERIEDRVVLYFVSLLLSLERE